MSLTHPKTHSGTNVEITRSTRCTQSNQQQHPACRAPPPSPPTEWEFGVPQPSAQSSHPHTSEPATSNFPDLSSAINLCEQFFCLKHISHTFFYLFHIKWHVKYSCSILRAESTLCPICSLLVGLSQYWIITWGFSLSLDRKFHKYGALLYSWYQHSAWHTVAIKTPHE